MANNNQNEFVVRTQIDPKTGEKYLNMADIHQLLLLESKLASDVKEKECLLKLREKFRGSSYKPGATPS